jgi:hypothetical protein
VFGVADRTKPTGQNTNFIRRNSGGRAVQRGGGNSPAVSAQKIETIYQAIVDKSKKEQRFYLLFVRSSGIRSMIFKKMR